MPRFAFRFQAVLRQREMIEECRQRELAQLLRLKMVLLDQLRQMQESVSQSKRNLGEALVGRVDLDKVTQFGRYSGQTAMRAHQIVQRLAQLQSQLETARAVLVKASAARKAMELLRDRHHAAWLSEENRREDRALDEVATQGAVRANVHGVES